jgi:hypothetical protein
MRDFYLIENQMKLADNYIAVGASQEDGCESCIVIFVKNVGSIFIPENQARKLADDILRNANYLWSNEKEQS